MTKIVLHERFSEQIHRPRQALGWRRQDAATYLRVSICNEYRQHFRINIQPLSPSRLGDPGNVSFVVCRFAAATGAANQIGGEILPRLF
jgi:hypothetical protein